MSALGKRNELGQLLIMAAQAHDQCVDEMAQEVECPRALMRAFVIGQGDMSWLPLITIEKIASYTRLVGVGLNELVDKIRDASLEESPEDKIADTFDVSIGAPLSCNILMSAEYPIESTDINIPLLLQSGNRLTFSRTIVVPANMSWARPDTSYFAMYVLDEAMRPYLSPSDLAVLEPVDSLSDDSVYALLIKGHLAYRRFVSWEKAGLFFTASNQIYYPSPAIKFTNDAIDLGPITPGEETGSAGIRVLGRVCAVMKAYA